MRISNILITLFGFGSRVWNTVTAPLVWFFFDRDAFKFKGVATFLLQLLGVLAALMSARVLERPVVVQAENVEPVGCLDASQYEENFRLKGLSYPKGVREAIASLIKQYWPDVSYQIVVGSKPTKLIQDPSEIRHHILCWYVWPRSPAREKEVQALREAIRTRPGSLCCPTGSEDQVQRQLDHARRLALGSDEMGLRRGREFRADSDLMNLKSYSSPQAPLDVPAVLRPSDARSAYANAESWKSGFMITAVRSAEEIVGALEQAGLDRLELAWALEQIDDVRRFINWIEVANRSSHAAAERATVTIDHGLPAELLTSTIEFVQRGSRFTARIEKLLPGETLWAIFRTRRPILPSEIRVIADPLPVFDPSNARRVLPVLGIIAALWIIANVQGRIRGR